MLKKKLMNTAIATMVTVGVAAMSATAQAADSRFEKCYGVAKAGKNDCATKKHSCGGLAKTDNDPAEWMFVPTGTCVKMGGKLTGPTEK